MNLSLIASARHLAHLGRPAWIHLRVVSGTLILGTAEQSVTAGEGLQITSADGVISLHWEWPDVWAAGPAVIQVLIP